MHDSSLHIPRAFTVAIIWVKMYAKLRICILFSQVPCHWPSRLFVSKFKMKRLHFLSHLFTSISCSLLESTLRMKNAKSLPWPPSFLYWPSRVLPAQRYVSLWLMPAWESFFLFHCSAWTKGFASPGKRLKSHLQQRASICTTVAEEDREQKGLCSHQ